MIDDPKYTDLEFLLNDMQKSFQWALIDNLNAEDILEPIVTRIEVFRREYYFLLIEHAAPQTFYQFLQRWKDYIEKNKHYLFEYRGRDRSR